MIINLCNRDILDSDVLPLAEDGFGWIVPAILGALLFTFISKYTNIGGVGEKYKILEEKIWFHKKWLS